MLYSSCTYFIIDITVYSWFIVVFFPHQMDIYQYNTIIKNMLYFTLFCCSHCYQFFFFELPVLNPKLWKQKVKHLDMNLKLIDHLFVKEWIYDQSFDQRRMFRFVNETVEFIIALMSVSRSLLDDFISMTNLTDYFKNQVALYFWSCKSRFLYFFKVLALN